MFLNSYIILMTDSTKIGSLPNQLSQNQPVQQTQQPQQQSIQGNQNSQIPQLQQSIQGTQAFQTPQSPQQQNTIVSHTNPLQTNYNPNITQQQNQSGIQGTQQGTQQGIQHTQQTQHSQQTQGNNDFSQVLNTIGSQPIHTGLPIRDVQQTTDHLMTDQQQQVNYAGDTNQQKYIQGDIAIEDAIQQAQKEDKKTDLENKIIDEIQTPIIIMFLFFVFQMPFVENKLLHYLPFLFTREKNLSLKGLLFKVLLFGGSYYILNKVVQKVIDM